MVICEDFAYHCLHRLFHCRSKYLPLYQLFHKKHHKFIYTVSISSVYAHPGEHLIVDAFSWHLGPILLGSRTHVWTMFFWGLIRHLESLDAHCGFEFPWSMFRVLPFGTEAAYHSFHHSKNVGNYSNFFTVWDTVFNANVDYYEVYGERGIKEIQKPEKTEKAEIKN
jgi:sterol desaturase/sphingolipid hydroxylase (fatty acid hydroxylase superfamily)